MSDTFQTKIVEDSWNTYICKSIIWTAVATPNWQILKIDADGNSTYPLNAEWFPTEDLLFSATDPTDYSYGYTYVKPS